MPATHRTVRGREQTKKEPVLNENVGMSASFPAALVPANYTLAGSAVDESLDWGPAKNGHPAAGVSLKD